MAERDPDDPARSEPPDGAPLGGPGGLPHPLDRIWAHPSELGPAAVAGPVVAPQVGGRRSAALVGALCGTILTLGVFAAAGGLDARDPQPRSPFVPAFPDLAIDRAAGLVATVSSSIVVVSAAGPDAERRGTGIVLGSGRILTNASLLTDDGAVTVTNRDGETVDAEVRGRDPETDLAVLVADGTAAPGARMGSADRVSVGSWVLAVGATSAQRRWADEGIVSGTDLVVTDPGGVRLAGMLATDIDASTVGGGPLLDESGAVVAILSRSVPGHAVPIDVARAVAAQLVAAGRAHHGWLGAFATDGTGRERSGALVQSVVPGGPAEAAGLEARDLITAVGERPITDGAGLASAISRLRPGDPVELTVWRGDERRRIKASLGERPTDAVGLAALQT